MDRTMDLNYKNFENWSPVRIYESNGGVFIDWIFLDDARFTESFHDLTIDILMRRPFNKFFRHQTPMNFLGELYEHSKGIAPRGFIFHSSRCGSTLVSQMLAAVSKNIVISEALTIDKIIRSNAPDEQKIVALRWLSNALAQKRFAEEENFFVKFDSWHILDLNWIELAFPDVPWIFLYRNPVEIIVSNLRQPGAQMIPGAITKIFPQINLPEILRFSIEERLARTIGTFYETALANEENPNGKFINYAQLPDAVMNEISTHFGVSFTDEEINKMSEKSKFNAKTPQLNFSPDTNEKLREAETENIRLAAKFVEPLYEKLEMRRLQK